MKKIFYSFAVLALFCCVWSCKEKTREQRVKEFQSELTEADSTQMLSLCDQCMELLKAGKIDQALDMIYYYDEEKHEVSELTTAFRSSFRHMFEMFPVYEYERSYYSFQLEGCNDVKYMVTFDAMEDPSEPNPYKTSFMFNPVKVDGQWYVTMKSATQDIDESRR